MRHKTNLLAAFLSAAIVIAPAAGRSEDAHHPAPPVGSGSEQPAPPGAIPDQATPAPGQMAPGMMAPGMMPERVGPMGPGMMGMTPGPEEPEALDDPVTAAFAAISRRMHRDMASEPDTAPDRQFALAMIAHHQGAIDMAKVILGFGSDPQIRKLAEDIIKAQENEITFLRQWLDQQSQ